MRREDKYVNLSILDEERQEEKKTAKKRRNAFWMLLAIGAALVALIWAMTTPVKSIEETKHVDEPAERHITDVQHEGNDWYVESLEDDGYLSYEHAEEPSENELIEQALLAKATRLDDVTITHYCICKKCCGKDPDDPGYGITASGRKATPGVSVAVDPSVIPLGSDVLVDYGDGEIHYYRADDTGGAVKGKHIDLCMASHEEALQAGVQKATVWFVPEDKE